MLPERLLRYLEVSSPIPVGKPQTSRGRQSRPLFSCGGEVVRKLLLHWLPTGNGGQAASPLEPRVGRQACSVARFFSWRGQQIVPALALWR